MQMLCLGSKEPKKQCVWLEQETVRLDLEQDQGLAKGVCRKGLPLIYSDLFLKKDWNKLEKIGGTHENKERKSEGIGANPLPVTPNRGRRLMMNERLVYIEISIVVMRGSQSIDMFSPVKQT